MSETFPVFVQVKRPDGTPERVRVGTAVRDGADFVLNLGELLIGSTPEPARRAAPSYDGGGGGYGGGGGSYGGSGGGAGGGAGGGGEVFPPYGRSKGMPVRDASMGDLEFYANGSRRSLSDPAKSRWHDKERQLLAAIEAEIERQSGSPPRGAPSGGAAPSGPAPSGGGRYAAPSAPPPFDEDAPPLGDDDIPF